jgi:hypothetical protein
MIPAENEIEYINQQEDADCQITIQKRDGSTLNMSTAPRLYIFVTDGYGNIVAKFKKGAGAAGYDNIDVTNDATGELSFKVLSTITKDLKPGHYYYEYLIRYYSASHTDDNFYDLPDSKLYLFSVKESKFLSLGTLPV